MNAEVSDVDSGILLMSMDFIITNEFCMTCRDFFRDRVGSRPWQRIEAHYVHFESTAEKGCGGCQLILNLITRGGTISVSSDDAVVGAQNFLGANHLAMLQGHVEFEVDGRITRIAAHKNYKRGSRQCSC